MGDLEIIPSLDLVRTLLEELNHVSDRLREAERRIEMLEKHHNATWHTPSPLGGGYQVTSTDNIQWTGGNNEVMTRDVAKLLGTDAYNYGMEE